MSSRQREWQRRKSASKRCMICGAAEYTAGYCKQHRDDRMKARRARSGGTGHKTCGRCGEVGHNRRGCPVAKAEQATADTSRQPNSVSPKATDGEIEGES